MQWKPRVRRKHILGGHCDGLMNYPLRNAILSFFHGGGGEHFVEAMETIRENYPPFAFYSAMNSLGTHDTPPDPHPAGGGGRVPGPVQGLAGPLPPVPQAAQTGQGPAAGGLPAAVLLPRLPHRLLRGRGGDGGL